VAHVADCRHLERFRDPWQEAKEEVEHQASTLLLGPGSRDYPAVLAHVSESDLVHAAQVISPQAQGARAYCRPPSGH